MFEFKKILLPTDFSEFSHRAMPYIIHWARAFQCEVHLFHGEKEGCPENDGDPRFEPLKKELETEGLKVFTASRSGVAPAPTIFHYAEENGIDLIIMATHGNRGMIRFFLGSVAEEVARTAPCSVLTLRTDEDPLTYWNNKTILVPTDFSRPSEIGVKVSAELAEHMAAKVHLVHIIESSVPPSLFMHGVRSYYEMVPELKERTQTVMQKILDQEFKGEGSFTVREGHVANEIRRIASHEHTGLIVMPSHGLSGSATDPMGHNTASVIRNAPCPVLTLRVYGKRSLFR